MAASKRIPEVGDIILVHDTDDLPPKAAIVESPPDEHGVFRIVVINWAYGKEGGTYRGIAYTHKYGERWEFKDERA